MLALEYDPVPHTAQRPTDMAYGYGGVSRRGRSVLAHTSPRAVARLPQASPQCLSRSFAEYIPPRGEDKSHADVVVEFFSGDPQPPRRERAAVP